MPKNPFGINLNYNPLLPSKKGKRTLGTRDKQILYNRAKGRCEACRKKIGYDEMQTGHKNAASKGGSATLRNSVCLCARCNKLQGTDNWSTFMKKMGKTKITSVTSVKRKKSTKKKRKKTREYNPFSLNIKPIKVPNPFKF
jgi:hypothetical protein